MSKRYRDPDLPLIGERTKSQLTRCYCGEGYCRKRHGNSVTDMLVDIPVYH
jgi:hypothetical protein